MSHTKLPWTLNQWGAVIQAESTGFKDTICTAGFGMAEREEAKANTALIVKAVNSHHELIALLEKILADDDEAIAGLKKFGYDPYANGNLITEEIRSTLARLK